jgi:hypothetical protein
MSFQQMMQKILKHRGGEGMKEDMIETLKRRMEERKKDGCICMMVDICELEVLLSLVREKEKEEKSGK